MNAEHQVTGGFFALVSPFGVLGGLVSLGFFSFHGAVFLTLRTEGPVRERAHRAARLLAVPVVVAAAGFLVWSFELRGGAVSVAMSALMAVALIISVLLDRRGREGWSFASSAVVAVAFPVFVFASLWPDVIPARNHGPWSLTVHNASSSHYTLVVMTVVALIFTPIVVVYQAWAYWVFRARVSEGSVNPMARLPRPAVSAGEAYQVTSPPDLAAIAKDVPVPGERGD
jgi:cytochrome d ubiquinol oxidase subunit II